MGDEKESRATIQRPSICRFVVIQRADGLPIGDLNRAHAPACVQHAHGGEFEAIDCHVMPSGGDPFNAAGVPYAGLAPEGYKGFTWTWPARV